MTNEQINVHPDVIKMKADLFDISSYMEYLKAQYQQVEKQRNEKVEELQKFINELQRPEQEQQEA